ncbi:MAG: tRNA (guanosine(37)-N1)-methyltransferase TrmD [Oscillospiraceae bacterium]|nr:tRNA (guanosine(37)-N1)-methyltransferase TrmD [Oscillospiraceae bacterium]
MRFDIATLFPEMCEAVLSESIIGRARRAGKLEAQCHQIRDYSSDKHRRADDAPYGGGMGMIMKAEPIYCCYTEVTKDFASKAHVIYMSPKGAVLTQKKALELSRFENIFIICGHYEGVDQRLIDKIADEEISVGDYVLTGGELPALVLVDAVSRMVEGVLPSAECFEDESHYSGLLEYPHYTRPEIWRGISVPEVLLSGHHKNIADYRRRESVKTTFERRPELFEKLHKE